MNVLHGLGAEIDTKSKSRLGVTLNGRTTVRTSLATAAEGGGDEILKFLEISGLRPRASGLENTLTT